MNKLILKAQVLFLDFSLETFSKFSTSWVRVICPFVSFSIFKHNLSLAWGVKICLKQQIFDIPAVD